MLVSISVVLVVTIKLILGVVIAVVTLRYNTSQLGFLVAHDHTDGANHFRPLPHCSTLRR